MQRKGTYVGSRSRCDPRLLPRIRDIWEEGCCEEAEEMAKRLTQIYPEYRRRKEREFVRSIEATMEKLRDGTTRKRMAKKVECSSNAFNLPETDDQQQKKARKSVSSFSMRSRRRMEHVEATMSEVRFADMGGCERQFLEVCRFAIHLLHPEIDDLLGVAHPTGFLLHGPPGCGKTLFAEAVAGEFGLQILKVAATEVISGISGETEQKIRSLFNRAVELSPCVLLLDEIDAIAPKRENAQREMERRIVSQLVACLDDLSNQKKSAKLNADKMDVDDMSVRRECNGNMVLVIGTTNRVENMDPALRRAGRFDKEIALGIPDKRARIKILEVVCRGLRLDENVTLQELARLTPGYVGADLKALAREAAMCAVNRIFETAVELECGTGKVDETELELQKMLHWLKSTQPIDEAHLHDIHITMEDFKKALMLVHPSAKREGFATVPDVTWNDIGALGSVREELKWSILIPIRQPDIFGDFGMESKPQGILLCGPPGCGKTLLAKAVANESGMNFISIKGPELLSMYVGESERAVRTVFQRARDSSPCVIFFDEIDALCPRRTGGENSGSSRLVNQLLTEMDGMESRKGVFLVGATNRPDIVDGAILRPGRLDKILFIDFPNAKEKEDILRKITKNGTHPRLSDDFSYQNIAADPALEWFTGADIAALVHEAGITALKESMSDGSSGEHQVTMRHFQNAARRIRPSVPERDRVVYQKLKETYGKLTSS